MTRDPETGKMTTRTCGNIRDEFRIPRFGFGDSHPRNFVTAQASSEWIANKNINSCKTKEGCMQNRSVYFRFLAVAFKMK